MRGDPENWRLQSGRVWRYPLLLGMLTLVGLLMALVRDDVPWRPLAWAALSVPLAVIVHRLAVRRR